ncbi:MAG: hypothetical protein IKK37_07525 [Clostridia bacterium]|nr:hypothetical protein [Clostridia bacterium]
MNGIRTISKKRILSNKSQSLLIIITVVLAIATLTSALSLSFSFMRFYINDAPRLLNMTSQEIKELGKHNAGEMLEYMDKYLEYFRAGGESLPPAAHNSEAVFSPQASVANLPVTVGALISVVAFSVYISLSVIFSVNKRSRRSFLATLMISGASNKMIKVCAFYDAVHFCAAALLPGVVLGVAETYITKAAANKVFAVLGERYSGIGDMPVNISFSFLSCIVAVLFVFAVVCMLSMSAARKLSVKNAATEVKQKIVTEIGLCAFTEQPKKYLFPGVEYYISFRSFTNNVGKYLRIITMSIMYVLMMGISFMVFSAIRNYNDYLAVNQADALVGFSYAFQIYFCASSVVMAVITAFSTFNALSANVNSNIGVFAIMRSAGSPIKSILRCVRLEGGLCNIIGSFLSVFSVAHFYSEVTEIYREELAVSLGEPEIPIIIGATFCLIFALSVAVSIIVAVRKMKKLDIVVVLKELLY